MSKTLYMHRRVGGRSAPMQLAHRVAWEEHNGPIPEGFQIHHIDGNSKNNDIENLMLLTQNDHQKYHSPYYFKLNSTWTRFCRLCKEVNKVFRKNVPTCNDCRAREARIIRRALSNEKTG